MLFAFRACNSVDATDAQDSVCIILVNITQTLMCSIMAKSPQNVSVTFLALVNTCCQQTVHTLASEGGIIAAVKQEAWRSICAIA